MFDIKLQTNFCSANFYDGKIINICFIITRYINDFVPTELKLAMFSSVVIFYKRENAVNVHKQRICVLSSVLKFT